MIDDLEGAYNAYQQALYYLKTPKDPNLWYAIGVLYDRYASYEHAKEAFTAALKIDPNFERKSEIYFRLAVIYKNQGLYDQSLDYLNYVLEDPPPQLALTTIQYQIALIYTLLNQPAQAKLIFEKILHEDPHHAKSLQQMGWIHFRLQSSNESSNLDIAIDYLLHSVGADDTDSQTWYLLGRCYMLLQNYNKAYDAYKQAVYHDKTNPILWCSIGVMYSRVSQHQDALGAYIRAIQINTCLSKVWYNIGTIYENCSQISDALDAYTRAAELEPNHSYIQERIALLRAQQTNSFPSSSLAISNPSPIPEESPRLQPISDSSTPSLLGSSSILIGSSLSENHLPSANQSIHRAISVPSSSTLLLTNSSSSSTPTTTSSSPSHISSLSQKNILQQLPYITTKPT